MIIAIQLVTVLRNHNFRGALNDVEEVFKGNLRIQIQKLKSGPKFIGGIMDGFPVTTPGQNQDNFSNKYTLFFVDPLEAVDQSLVLLVLGDVLVGVLSSTH